MANPKIIPQKFSFESPTIANGNGKIVSHGISVTVDIDAFKQIKQKSKRT